MLKYKTQFKLLKSPLTYWLGMHFYRKKDWVKAQYYFQQSANEAPNHAYSFFKLGMCYFRHQDWETAYYYFDKAITLSPGQTQWQVQLRQCEKKIDLIAPSSQAKVESLPVVRKQNVEKVFIKPSKRTLLLIPTDYSAAAVADIKPFIEFYADKFDVYLFVREKNEVVNKLQSCTVIINGDPYGEYLKFTADFIIDAGTLNFYYKIGDVPKWYSVWHGIPYKKMFVDLSLEHLTTGVRYGMAYDGMVSMSPYYSEVFLRKAMSYTGRIFEVGCAKVDALFKDATEAERSIRQIAQDRIGIEEPVLVLYAPLFRKAGNYSLPFNVNKLLESVGQNAVLLTILDHRNVLLDQHERLIDVSHFGLSSLVNQVDYLITDYSNIIFNFYNVPIVLYQYDYNAISQENKKLSATLERYVPYDNVVTRESQLYSLVWNNLARNNLIYSLETKEKFVGLKGDLGIEEDKKVVLYAPTYRQKGKIKLPFDPNELLKALGEDYVLIVKLHYLNELDGSFKNVIDCTKYSEVTELMKISDILISDYSSLVLDYALLKKPIILYQYDHFDYFNNRGVYFDFDDYIDERFIINREKDLYNLDWSDLGSAEHTRLIERFYPWEMGESTQRIVECLNLDAQIRETREIIFLVNELHQFGGVHSFLKNMAKHYKQRYNTKIYVLAIKEFAQSNSELHYFDNEYVDFQISSQYLNGACASILQNTDGIIISLQFSAHLHFQKHLDNADVILMFHGDVKDVINREMYGPHLDWLNHHTLCNYKKLVFLTENNLKLISPYLNQEVRSRSLAISNSIDLQLTPLPQNAHTLRNFAYIGRLDHDKNALALLELAKQIQKEGKDLCINVYGDGPLKTELEESIREFGLERILILKGFESDKHKIFSENGALVLVSKSEGLPLVIIEAYAHARPVIAFSTFTAVTEVVLHGQTGLLSDIDDYSAFVSNMERVHSLTSTDRIQQHFEQFSNSTIFAKWDTILEQLPHDALLRQSDPCIKPERRSLKVNKNPQLEHVVSTSSPSKITVGKLLLGGLISLTKKKPIAEKVGGITEQPLVSILVPCYNSTATIAATLQSIRELNYKNLDIMVVDDGSVNPVESFVTDLKDPRFRYFWKENEGLGLTRNFGINNALGEYIFFLDSDDVVYKDSIDNLVNYAQEHDLEVVSGVTVRKEYDTGKESEWFRALYKHNRIDELNNRLDLYNDTLSTNKLYRVQALKQHNIYFEEGLYEDKLFTAKLYSQIEQIGLISNRVYVWLIYGANSSISTSKTVDNFKGRMLAIKKLWEYLPEIRRVYQIQFFINHDLLIYLREFKDYSEEEKREIFEISSEFYKAREKYVYNRILTTTLHRAYSDALLTNDYSRFKYIAESLSKLFYKEELV